MKKNLLLLMLILVLGSCTNNIIETDSMIETRVVHLPYIEGNTSPIVGSQETYTLWDIPISYRVEWDHLNATKISSGNNKITLKFTSKTQIVLTANIYETGTNKFYTARLTINPIEPTPPSPEPSISGPETISKVEGGYSINVPAGATVNWKLKGNSYMYIYPPKNNTKSVIVRRGSTSADNCTILAQVIQGKSKKVYSKKITQIENRSLEAAYIEADLNSNTIELKACDNVLRVDWEVNGDHRIGFQGISSVRLIPNNKNSFSKVTALVTTFYNETIVLTTSIQSRDHIIIEGDFPD